MLSGGVWCCTGRVGVSSACSVGVCGGALVE